METVEYVGGPHDGAVEQYYAHLKTYEVCVRTSSGAYHSYVRARIQGHEQRLPGEILCVGADVHTSAGHVRFDYRGWKR